MSMPPIILTVPVFSDRIDRQTSERILLWFLEGLTRANQELLKAANPPLAPLYKSGVYYAEPGKPQWQDILTLYERGKGDCKDLATARVAEIRTFGKIKAMPFVTWRKKPSGAYSYHVLVKYPSGKLEDPSRRLGMGSDPGPMEPYNTGE